MRRTVRTAAVSLPALAVVALAWLRLEQPPSPFWRVAALLGLALGAAWPRRRWLRAAGAVAATVAAARIAVGVDLVPWRLDDPGSAFGLTRGLSSLGARFGVGFDDFYGTHLPFDPRLHPAMDELVLSGLFVFSLGITLLVAARRPVAGTLALLLGAGWPATLLGPSHGVGMGAAILAAALVVLAGLGSRRVPALALPATAVVATAAVTVGSATAARHGLVHWQGWNLANVAGGPTDVGFVWNAQYGGLDWPAHPTIVLQVQSSERPSYLRAAVLDDFAGDRWSLGLPRAADSLEPPAARRPQNETREVVTVNNLADTRLVGGSIPIRFEAAGAPLIRPEPGFASLDQNLPHGFRYTVWSYTRRPSRSALRRSPARYPPALADGGLLDVGRGVTPPPFGRPGRRRAVDALLAASPALAPYAPLARAAERVAGGSSTPYGAVSRLEYWFVSSGTFSYSNHPPVTSTPLAGFVTTTHSGYCQYFAGAMTLMLRYLGIPARVAVGFAGGTFDPKARLWNVTDREAHAWVEVWFRGYGWIPFDPTPAAPGAAPRPTQARASAGSTPGGAAPTPHRAHAGTSRDTSPVAEKLEAANGIRSPRGGPHAGAALPGSSPGGTGGGTDRSRPALLLLAAVVGVVGAVVLAKLGVRLARNARRDPRRVAAACRHELASFLLDQRIEAPRSATLADLGEILRHEFGVKPEAFVAAATAARFAPPGLAATGAAAARRELRSLLESARRGLTRPERLRGLLSPRSLTRSLTPVAASTAAGSGPAESRGT